VYYYYYYVHLLENNLLYFMTYFLAPISSIVSTVR